MCCDPEVYSQYSTKVNSLRYGWFSRTKSRAEGFRGFAESDHNSRSMCKMMIVIQHRKEVLGLCSYLYTHCALWYLRCIQADPLDP